MSYDGSRRGPRECVAFKDVFPSAWDLAVMVGGKTYWGFDNHCVEAACACRDVVIQVVDERGKTRGEVVVEIGRNGTRLRQRSPSLPAAVARAFTFADRDSQLTQRFERMRYVARRLATWVNDCNDPSVAIAAAFAASADREADAWDRVRVIGDRARRMLRAALAGHLEADASTAHALATLVQLGDAHARTELASTLTTGEFVATGERGYQIHRHHRCPGTHPVACGRFFALAVPRRRAQCHSFAERS